SRPAACESAVRRLDRGDTGPFAVGPVRAHHRGDGHRLRDLHDLAQWPRQAALPDLSAFCHGTIANAPGTPHPCGVSAACSVRMPKTLKHETRKGEENGGGAESPPHYLGHRERLRDRFLDGGPDAITEYELLELVLFRAIPRRDVKPLAKALIAKFGSFAEVVSAPRPRLREIEGLGEAALAEIQTVQAAANRLARGEVKKRTVLSSWSAVLDYCRTTMAFADKEQ